MKAWQDLLWLLFRLAVGLSMATHGYAKLFTLNYNGERTVEAFSRVVATLGFPFPLFFAYAAALAEFIGGLLLAIGLFGRAMGLLLASVMAVAIYRHQEDAFSSMELAIIYLASMLAILAVGSGNFSTDTIIKAWRNSRSGRGESLEMED